MLEEFLHFVGTLKIFYFDLSGNDLSLSETKGFLDSLFISLNSSNLRVVNLSNNSNLKLEGVLALLDSLSQAKNLEALFLDNTGLH